LLEESAKHVEGEECCANGGETSDAERRSLIISMITLALSIPALIGA
jgi:hypothetical protein